MIWNVIWMVWRRRREGDIACLHFPGELHSFSEQGSLSNSDDFLDQACRLLGSHFPLLFYRFHDLFRVLNSGVYTEGKATFQCYLSASKIGETRNRAVSQMNNLRCDGFKPSGLRANQKARMKM